MVTYDDDDDDDYYYCDDGDDDYDDDDDDEVFVLMHGSFRLPHSLLHDANIPQHPQETVWL